MTKLSIYIAAIVISLISALKSYGQTETITVDQFDTARISPHIQVTFIKGDQEAVTIENASVSREKINIEVEGKTLKIYLDDAKMVTKNETVKEDGWKRKKPIYKGTQVTAIVTYRDLKELSVGGEEMILCKSPIDRDDFKLKIYGELKMTLNSLKVNSLQVSMYGESDLEIKEGMAKNQKYIVYGEGTINAIDLANENTKITAYGESSFRINVKEHLKVTAFGETTVAYRGNPSVSKGIVLGEATIQKIN